MAKVFIGMPVYNGERYIEEALRSLVAQNFTDWKMLISDDASTDGTAKVALDYAKKDSRITYYKQAKNLGLFENFKFTLDQSNSEYFMWAAQDDLREKTYLETCVNYLDKDSGLGLATTCIAAIDSQGQTVLEEHESVKLSGKPSMRNVARYILQPEVSGKCNLMYGVWRTDAALAIWQAYPQRNAWGQDYMFSLALVARFGVYVDKQVLFKKRFGGFSNQGGLEESRIAEIRRAVENNPKNRMFPFLRFKRYLTGHLEALAGTPYRLLAPPLLFARLPRAFAIYLSERNFRKLLVYNQPKS